MPEFDDDTLIWMRDTVLDTLNQSASLYAPQYASDAGGGEIITWHVVAENVPCRLYPMRADADRWQFFADGLVNPSRYRAVFLHDAPLTADSRVVVAGVGYQVLNLSTAHGAKVVIHAVLQADVGG